MKTIVAVVTAVACRSASAVFSCIQYPTHNQTDLRFPRDAGLHENNNLEWWYYISHGATRHGDPIGLVAILVRSVDPVTHISTAFRLVSAALPANATHGPRLLADSRLTFERPGAFMSPWNVIRAGNSSERLPFLLHFEDLIVEETLAPGELPRTGLAGARYRLSVEATDSIGSIGDGSRFSFSLNLTDHAGATLQGFHGYDSKGPSDPTFCRPGKCPGFCPGLAHPSFPWPHPGVGDCCCGASHYFTQGGVRVTGGSLSAEHFPAGEIWEGSDAWLERETRSLSLSEAQPTKGYSNFIWQMNDRGLYGSIRLIRNNSDFNDPWLEFSRGAMSSRSSDGTYSHRTLSMAMGDFTAVAFDPSSPADPRRVAYWTSPRSKFRYALWWRISIRDIPDEGSRANLTFEMWPRWEDQEISFRPVLWFPFYEGAGEARNAQIVHENGLITNVTGLSVFLEQVTYGVAAPLASVAELGLMDRSSTFIV